MTGDQIAQLSYLVLLGTAIAGMFFVYNRGQLGKSLQYAAIWALIFIGGVAAVGLWQDVSRQITATQTVSDGVLTVPLSRDGHYYLTLDVDGTEIDFLVDTGATETVLTMADARRLGLDVTGLDFIGRASTANGTVRTAPVRLDRVVLGPWEDFGVRASITEGELVQSLLGMSYLSRYDIGLSNGTLTLRR